MYIKQLLRLKRRWSRIQLRSPTSNRSSNQWCFIYVERSTVDRWIDRYSGRWYVYAHVYKVVAAAEKEMGAYTAVLANIESQLQAMVFYIRDRSTVDRWIDRYSGRWVVYVYVYKAVAAAEKEMGAYTAVVANIESQLQATVLYIRR